MAETAGLKSTAPLLKLVEGTRLTNEKILYRYIHGNDSLLVEIIYDIDADMYTAMLKEFKRNEVIKLHTNVKNRDKYIGYVEIAYNNKDIEIMSVSIGRGARKTRVCTKAVAYTMKALLTYIGGKHLTATTGSVQIVSETPLEAFNCYNRAFLANGYVGDEQEYADFSSAYEAFLANGYVGDEQAFEALPSKNKLSFKFHKYVPRKGADLNPIGPLDLRYLRF